MHPQIDCNRSAQRSELPPNVSSRFIDANASVFGVTELDASARFGPGATRAASSLAEPGRLQPRSRSRSRIIRSLNFQRTEKKMKFEIRKKKVKKSQKKRVLC